MWGYLYYLSLTGWSFMLKRFQLILSIRDSLGVREARYRLNAEYSTHGGDKAFCF